MGPVTPWVPDIFQQPTTSLSLLNVCQLRDFSPNVKDLKWCYFAIRGLAYMHESRNSTWRMSQTSLSVSTSQLEAVRKRQN